MVQIKRLFSQFLSGYPVPPEVSANFSFNFRLTGGGTMLATSPPKLAASFMMDELVKIQRRPVMRKTV
jgi:hypothetical protein